MGRFVLSLLLISAILTLLAAPWTSLSWWKVFRRCVSIAAALSLWLCIRRWEGRSLRAYGLGAWAGSGGGKRQLRFGLGLGLAALGMMLGIGVASGAVRFELTPDRVRLWRTVLGFVPVAALVSVLEELVFRGLLLQRLMACSTPLAVGLSSACYALVHLKESTFTAQASRELGGLFLLGVVLSLSYLRTRQLYLAIGLHAVLAYGARVNKLVIAFADPSNAWLVGTSRLVDGVLAWAALAGAGGCVLWWTRRMGVTNPGRALSSARR
ncbi:MAG: CPBP family intramembrane metalloprotease [Candidatus Omnitrophica bacterium]|nr:CPBP family intramembrane metalloprotease [Candidatus Omnitrophota bacterium]